MTKVLYIQQGSEEWLKARCGSLGASRLHEALARTKSGMAASRKNIIIELAVEQLTGQPTPSFVSGPMEWGTKQEANARAAYSFLRDVEVTEVGLCRHGWIDGTHASPDGLVGNDGLIEIKCPNSATHAEYLLTKEIPQKYIYQMQWQMECTGRDWCDFVSYDPRMPMELQVYICRYPRDHETINRLKKEVVDFLHEVEMMVARLREAV